MSGGAARISWPATTSSKGKGSCSCSKGANCHSNGKHPHTKNGVYDATTDESTIKQWWKQWPKANIGLRTGADSGLIILDVDPRNSGDESLKELKESHGPLPKTWVVETGGGGWHFYFSYPTEVVAVKSQAHLANGIEVKSDGAYVVAPPSLHGSGERYKWVPSTLQETLIDIPQWLIAPSEEGAQWSGGGFPTEDLAVMEAEGVTVGQRDVAAVKLLGLWVAQGTIDSDTLVGRLLQWNSLNQPLMGKAAGDQEPKHWAIEKVDSVLNMEKQNHPDRFQHLSQEQDASPD